MTPFGHLAVKLGIGGDFPLDPSGLWDEDNPTLFSSGRDAWRRLPKTNPGKRPYGWSRISSVAWSPIRCGRVACRSSLIAGLLPGPLTRSISQACCPVRQRSSFHSTWGFHP